MDHMLSFGSVKDQNFRNIVYYYFFLSVRIKDSVWGFTITHSPCLTNWVKPPWHIVYYYKIPLNNFLCWLSWSPSSPFHRIKNHVIYSPYWCFEWLSLYLVICISHIGVWLQAIYSEAIAMVEEYQQAISVSNLGGIRDTGNLYPQLGLRTSPQVLNYYYWKVES